MVQSARTMDNEPNVKVEVIEDARALVITLPGTNYQIRYRKLEDLPRR